MTQRFIQTYETPSVQSVREANGVSGLWATREADETGDRLTESEVAFIAERDSFYLSTVSRTGWPYIQHRGGPPGFLRVLDDRTLGFVDFRGNRQYLTVGNLIDEDRVALILVDYAHRRRLKILARMAAHDLKAELELAERLATPGYRGFAERGFVLKLHAFDWNCPQHITPRFTAAEIATAIAPLRARLEELEAENARLRGGKEHET